MSVKKEGKKEEEEEEERVNSLFSLLSSLCSPLPDRK